MKTDWPELTAACRLAMQAATDSPGLYGGRYVARKEDGTFVTLDTDDPEAVIDPNLDIMAQATPNEVYGIGRAGNYLLPNGAVKF